MCDNISNNTLIESHSKCQSVQSWFDELDLDLQPRLRACSDRFLGSPFGDVPSLVCDTGMVNHLCNRCTGSCISLVD
jgi:hypothetical protein